MYVGIEKLIIKIEFIIRLLCVHLRRSITEVEIKVHTAVQRRRVHAIGVVVDHLSVFERRAERQCI